MKILITGGAGTLGSNIIERLIKKSSIEIICIDNFETGSRDNISFFPKQNLIEGSVSDLQLMERLFKNFRPNVIIHCAASYKNPDEFQHDANTNIIGSINVGRLSETYKVSKVINLQTALCYGKPIKVPIPINHPINPFTSYGISKAHGEYYLSKMSIPLISLRLANICSKKLSIGPIPTFYSRIKEGKSCFCSDAKRDFLDFDDFFDLLMIILFKSDCTGIFNVSTGLGHTISNLFDQVKYSMGNKNVTAKVKKVNSDDVSEVILDPSFTEKTFGWKSKISFPKMIKKQIQFYEEFGIHKIFSHLKNNDE